MEAETGGIGCNLIANIDGVGSPVEPASRRSIVETPIDIDLANAMRQIQADAREGGVAVRRSLRRSQVPGFFNSIAPALIGIEACYSVLYCANAIIQFL